jgi:hypothetical protein
MCQVCPHPLIMHQPGGQRSMTALFTTSDISSDRMALALSGPPPTAMTFGTACSFQRGCRSFDHQDPLPAAVAVKQQKHRSQPLHRPPAVHAAPAGLFHHRPARPAESRPTETAALGTCRYRITPVNNDQPTSAADAFCS